MTDVTQPSEARKKIDKLKQQNDDTFERIAKLGGSINMASVEVVRDQHLMGWIYENVMTEAQREDFLLSWHERLAEDLKKLEGEARERTIAAQRPKLVRPGAPGFTLPGNLRG